MTRYTQRAVVSAFLFLSSLTSAPAKDADFPVQITVDASEPLGELKPIWRFFGADEPNYTYMPEGEKLLGELGKMKPGEVFFRTHNLLTTGDGTPALKWGSTNAYTEDAEGRPIYDWTIVDMIFDAGLQRGVRPFVQIGFMPKALSIKPEPYQHQWTPEAGYNEIFTGWAYPPKDYAKWEELVFQWAKHCVEKYGRDEVLKWYWETWNEANIPYWRGTREEFFKLHDHAIRAVRRALPEAKVGGPDVAGGPGGTFLAEFLTHCQKAGTPVDFISFHAKGKPEFVDGHVRMGISHHLNDIDRAFKVIAGFPEFKDKPIVIGESDPEGCAACQGPQLGYRNGTMYSSYTAASFARKHDLAARHDVNLEGALTWAFTFVDQPIFGGFRQLASGGIDHPVLNTFRMFSKMSGQRLDVQSSAAIALDDMMKNGVRDKPDVSALASMDGGRLCVLAWHYHEDDVPGPDAAIDLSLAGLPANSGKARVEHYRIDADHSNAYEVWKKLGSPPNPTPEQQTTLEKAGQLAVFGPAEAIAVKDGAASIRVQLPRQAVSLLVVTMEP
ncbi:beta-xylosidase [Phragmitibacter flavus]|uniref:Beta-xylosidase n=1 Tax=Phragmitibacter flavus TaxID=2576071 RepID=A0A5R8KBW5_9BACT|nr:beta-xylosidase [Phragmitibacter flavus]TLD69049.1 beta-xylosidase [Phragmitibacter flavus]